jgi:hypothetical protein
LMGLGFVSRLVLTSRELVDEAASSFPCELPLTPSCMCCAVLCCAVS